MHAYWHAHIHVTPLLKILATGLPYKVAYSQLLHKLKFWCSEFASEDILDQTSPCVFKKMVWLQVVQLLFIVGGDSMKGVNYRAPEMAIYLCMYLRVSFHLSGVTALYACVPRSPAGPPWTKVVLLVATIKNLFGQRWFSSEPLTNGWLKCIARRCIKFIEV